VRLLAALLALALAWPAHADEQPPGTGLYIAGLSVFAASYVPTSVYGITQVDHDLTLAAGAQIPILGPLAFGGSIIESDHATGALLVVDGMAQAVGLFLIFFGDAKRRRALEPLR
jgi:hypothetical protein